MGLIFNPDGTVEVWDNNIDRYGKSDIDEYHSSIPPKGTKRKKKKRSVVAVAPSNPFLPEFVNPNPVFPESEWKVFVQKKISELSFITDSEQAIWKSKVPIELHGMLWKKTMDVNREIFMKKQKERFSGTSIGYKRKSKKKKR